ncbi:hypothetical protein PVT71_12330 [Salipiger sp. H15]|uniref:Uncharacterized protein n=1 Tax=Alloyangia sp. H15 TaxID=3029062 RepID=A0AAU8AFA1_9RHOB
MSRSVAEHEARHVLAAAIALQRLAPARYKDAEVTVKIGKDEGSVVIEIGDVIADPRNLELSQQVAALAAVGPAAKTPDALDLLRRKAWDEVVQAGGLSHADVELIAKSHVADASLACAHVVAGVQALEQRLGLLGFHRLGKALQDASSQAFFSWQLAELVPQGAAAAAVKEAAQRLDDLLHPNTALKRIKARTAAQERVAADKEGKQ